MFRRIQNESLKKDCIWVRIRGAFLAKKGAPKLNFHREGGGQLPPSAPPKSATGRTRNPQLTFQPFNTSIICHYVNMLILVIYYKKFDSDCQSHCDDSINLKGLSVLKTSLFCLFLVRFSSALLVSNLFSLQYILGYKCCCPSQWVYNWRRCRHQDVLPIINRQSSVEANW